MKSSKYLPILIIISLIFSPYFFASLLAQDTDTPPDGLFSTVTDDNVTLKMRRYRPTPDADFNNGRQPVLIMPGLFNSLNEFITYTPADREIYYDDMELDQPIAEWAIGDEYIEDDPMRYFSLAHYLWLKGYDPWFANYRGIGRGEFKSDIGSVLTNLDVWSALDVPAFVNRIYEETEKYPVIGGHSTGGLVAYCYLQGIYFDVEEMGDEYIPHIKSDPELAKLRNSQIKGFIGIDPASVFPMSSVLKNLLNNNYLWSIYSTPFYIDVDYIMGTVVSALVEESDPIILSTQIVIGAISALHDYYPEYLPAEYNFFMYLDCWRIEKTHPYVVDFIARHSVSSSYMRVISQYFDALIYNHLREHYMNGEENKDRMIGPEPDPGVDGYYNYGDNMHLMSVPAYLLLSDNDSLVGKEQAVDFILNGKTANENDDWFVVPGSAHVELSFGYDASTISFPKIGEWLNKVCPITTMQVDEVNVDEIDNIDSIRDGNKPEDLIPFVVDNSTSDSTFGCGSLANASTIHDNNNPIMPGMINIIFMMLLPLGMILLHRRIKIRK